MRKPMIMSLAAAALVLAFVLPNLYATQVQAPGDDYMIPKPAGIEVKRKSLPFPHSEHVEISCGDCHHTVVDGNVVPWDGISPLQGCTDAGCHDVFVAETPEEKRDIRFFERAYHKQCLGCHRDLKKAEKSTGPVACVGCHPKEPKEQ